MNKEGSGFGCAGPHGQAVLGRRNVPFTVLAEGTAVDHLSPPCSFSPPPTAIADKTGMKMSMSGVIR